MPIPVSPSTITYCTPRGTMPREVMRMAVTARADTCTSGVKMRVKGAANSCPTTLDNSTLMAKQMKNALLSSVENDDQFAFLREKYVDVVNLLKRSN